MNKGQLNQRLLDMITGSGYPQFKLLEAEQIKDVRLATLGVDSIGMLKVLIEIEHEFGIDWDNTDLAGGNLSTIDHISTYLLDTLYPELPALTQEVPLQKVKLIFSDDGKEF